MSTPDDVSPILQQVIDHPDLQQYLHPELPERKPLAVARTAAVSEGVKLSKFDSAVEIREEAELEGRPFLRFDGVEIDGAEAQVRLSYPVEGLRVDARLQREGGAWSVSSFSLVER